MRYIIQFIHTFEQHSLIFVQGMYIFQTDYSESNSALA